MVAPPRSMGLPRRRQIWHGAPMSKPERRRRRALARLLGAVVPAVCGACGAPHVDKPPAPDMSQLVADYEHPSATFDPGDAPQVLAALALTDGLLAQTDLRT